ncbi:MAG: hypothetical protein WAN66_16220 [Limnoraphis robusta]|uniref:hypothetical protein n=1 Tax=Limnoraphis robusta TaxID=1118279 RepID=UPI0013649DAB|nr:hypothetical protein [Limnoraphis robusta]
MKTSTIQNITFQNIVIPSGVRTLTGLTLEEAIAENAKRRLEASLTQENQPQG